jgi:hypothetical protein
MPMVMSISAWSRVWGRLCVGPVGPYVLAGFGRLVGGIGERLFSDWIDAPCSPRHRAEAHSMSITGTVGYFMNQQLPQPQANLRAETQRYTQLGAASPALLPTIECAVLEFLLRFLSGLLAGLHAGYAWHLALDSLTPSSLPIRC